MTRYGFAKFTLAAVMPSLVIAADGALDPTFGQDGLQIVAFDLGHNNFDGIRGISVLPDGRILFAGEVDSASDPGGIGLTRLTAKGQFDEDFGRPWHRPAGLAGVRIADAALQPDGKLVVVGYGMLISPGQVRALICRFMPDGSVDTGFATLDNVLAPGCRVLTTNNNSVFEAVVVQRDGRIVLAGGTQANVGRGLVVRLDGQGNFDASFGTGGEYVLLPQSTYWTQLRDIGLTPDGGLVAIGYTEENDNRNWQVVRLREADGELDTEFDSDGLKSIGIDLIADGYDEARAISVQSDGRIVVGGTATNGSDYCPAIARLMPDGELDSSLNGSGLYVDPFCTATGDIVKDLLVQSDSRIVLSGSNGDFVAMRFESEGGRDVSFGQGGLVFHNFAPLTGVDSDFDAVYRMVGHGGRVLLAGQTNEGAESGADFAIARLDNDLIFFDDLE